MVDLSSCEYSKAYSCSTCFLWLSDRLLLFSSQFIVNYGTPHTTLSIFRAYFTFLLIPRPPLSSRWPPSPLITGRYISPNPVFLSSLQHRVSVPHLCILSDSSFINLDFICARCITWLKIFRVPCITVSYCVHQSEYLTIFFWNQSLQTLRICISHDEDNRFVVFDFLSRLFRRVRVRMVVHDHVC